MNLPHSAIYDLAYAEGGDVMIGAEFEGRVHVYSAEDFRKMRDFPVSFGFGGKRISVSAQLPLVFCGCYARTGLGAYDYTTGAEVWRLRPLRQFQHVTTDVRSPFVFANCESGSAYVIEAATGRVADRLPRCKDIYCSTHSPIYLIEGNGRHQVQGPLGVKRFTIKAESFAILHASFGPHTVAFSESGGTVRIFDLDLGIEVGRYIPAAGSHVLNLAWCDALGQFVLIEWPYERGGDRVLKSFDPATREVSTIATMPLSTKSVFVDHGDRVFTTEGHIVDVRRGTIIHAVEIPRAKSPETRRNET